MSHHDWKCLEVLNQGHCNKDNSCFPTKTWGNGDIINKDNMKFKDFDSEEYSFMDYWAIDEASEL